MDETKAVTTGLITGGALGWGLAIAGAFLCPAIPVVVGTGLTVASMIGGAVAGGNAALKIAEKINKRKD
ncbi:MAG: hypothetical protein IJW08_00265 [Lentisphaeria bacterium]|nr:hypothetical protein [Lentisphaeria bacterium]